MSKDEHNLQYFEAASMRELFQSMQAWQDENDKRFLSIEIEKDNDKFCCISLTNPMQDSFGTGNARVEHGRVYVDIRG